jgi:hypothetical protein
VGHRQHAATNPTVVRFPAERVGHFDFKCHFHFSFLSAGGFRPFPIIRRFSAAALRGGHRGINKFGVALIESKIKGIEKGLNVTDDEKEVRAIMGMDALELLEYVCHSPEYLSDSYYGKFGKAIQHRVNELARAAHPSTIQQRPHPSTIQ